MKQLLDNVKGYIQDLKRGEKKFSKDGMLILFFSGLLIYVILLPINNNGSYKITAGEDKEKVEEYRIEKTEETDYQEKLEKELEEFLSHVEGIGEVEVLIYLDSTEEYIVEKDNPSQQIVSEGSGSKSSEENKEEDTVYTVNESGNQVPFITQTKHPAIEGVVIAAQGAGEEKIRIQIIRTVMALYGVEANKVDVLERKNS